jgi:peptidoglycan/LPS O-acetylase OafA/YrhL
LAERLDKPSEELPQGHRPEEIHKTADPRPHSVELDALRGIGALGVVLFHALGPWYRRIEQPLIIPLLNIDLIEFLRVSVAHFSVGILFLISGYLLVGTESRRASRGNYSLRSYALRRILRIAPAYYAAMVVVFLLWPREPTLTDTLLHLSFLQTFWPDYHASAYDPAWWYLTSEVLFYAMLPLLVLKLRGLYARLALFGVLVAMSLTIEIYSYMDTKIVSDTLTGYPSYLLQFPLRFLWPFMAGVLLRMLVDRLNQRSPGPFRPILTFSLFVGSLVLLVLAFYVDFVRVAADLHIMVTIWLAIPFFAAAVLGSPVLSRILSWRLLGFVGMISYSLYLLHETVLMLVRIYLWRSPARPLFYQVAQLDGIALWLAFAGYLGSVLVVCGAVAYLSYRYIESPFLRIRPK